MKEIDAQIKKITGREISLDIIKLIAVFFMFAAHTVAFLFIGYRDTTFTPTSFDAIFTELIVFARGWGDLTSFSIFLIVSSALLYISGFSMNKSVGERLIRLGRIMIVYYVLAFILSLRQLSGRMPEEVLVEVGRILTLQSVPGYSEFYLAFVGFGLIVIIFRSAIIKLAKKPFLLLGLSLVAFALGEGLLRLSVAADLPNFLQNWGSLIYGSYDLYRFPILQYSPLFAIGLLMGMWLKDHKLSLSEKRIELKILVAVICVVVGIAIFASPEDFIRRWPPTLGFLALGLAWALLQMNILVAMKWQDKIPDWLCKLAEFVGRNLLALLLVHTAILSIYSQLQLPLLGVKSTIFAGFIVIIMTVILVRLFNSIMIFLQRVSGARLISVSVIALAGLVIVLVLAQSQTNFNQLPPQNDTAEEELVVQSDWKGANSPSRLSWEISEFAEDCCESFVRLDLNHADLVQKNESREDANDFELFYQGLRGSRMLEIAVEDESTTFTKIYANLSGLRGELGPGQLKLYFGNIFNSAQSPRLTGGFFGGDFNPDAVTVVNLNTVVPEQEFPVIRLVKSRLWNLTDSQIEIPFNVPEFIAESDGIFWELRRLDGSVASKGPVNWSPTRSLLLRINLENYKDSVEGGYYYLGLNFELSDVTIRSAEATGFLESDLETAIPLIISAPIYMTWTIDWEGYDLQEIYMRAMAELSSRYGMPMTHYFNPRIYTNPAITPERARSLTNWVLNREKLGDEISLHLHMHFDLVAAAGLTPKTSPSWGGRTEGHDVLTTAYNREELGQILRWAKQKFAENGLPVPPGYRAGGWFMNLENLKALADNGFVYDTSGSDFRDPYGINRQSRDWALEVTSRPYQVSSTNQNTSTPPLLPLWEYPNNGADSTNRTEQELIRRLHLNLASTKSGSSTSGSGNSSNNSTGSNNQTLISNSIAQPMIDAQVLNYLSHPHWFNIDQPRMQALFEAAENYKYENDKGPLVYVTQIDAHNKYTQLLAD